MALLVAGASAIIGLITYMATRDSLTGALDSQLQNTSRNYAVCMEVHNQASTSPHQGPPAANDDYCSRGQPQGMLGVRIKNGQITNCGVVTQMSQLTCKPSAADTRALLALPAYNAGSPPPGLHQPPASAPGSSGGDTSDQPPPGPPVHPVTFTSATLSGGYRLTAVRGGDGDTLIAGLPVASVRNQLREVAMAEVSVILGVLALAGLAGGLLVRVSLRPLRRVASTAAHVAELPLDSGTVSLPPGVPDDDPRSEIGQVGAAFNRMLGTVARALTRRAASEARLRRFAADASHELRTPLASIRGYAELALRHPGPVPDEVTHALTRVHAESARMSVLVDDLLLLARLDAGRPLERAPVDLSRLAIDATSDARVTHGDHRWILRLPDEPVLVTGDEHRLHQVLGNLLSNAAKHTPPGSTVSVEVAVTAVPDPVNDGGGVSVGASPPLPWVQISVTDDGPGIPDDLLPEVFERFARADTSRARSAGNGGSTGLGLAIVAAVVAAHDGSVTVTSRPGRTRFTIQLGYGTGPACQLRS
jgi:two-component system OmpR family sensor kinase